MDRVRMTALSVFHNARITPVAPDPAAEGAEAEAFRSPRDGTAQVGDVFETDAAHAKDLARAGLAQAHDQDALDAAETPPETPSPNAIASNRVSTTKKLA